MYLFLNDKIRAEVDLSDEAHNIRAHLAEFYDGGAQVVPLVPAMVRWLALENESRKVEKRIHECLSNPDPDPDPDPGVEKQSEEKEGGVLDEEDLLGAGDVADSTTYAPGYDHEEEEPPVWEQ